MNGFEGKWKFDLVFGLMMLAVVALAVRLALLMRDTRAEGVRMTERQQRMTYPLPARLGNIYARTRNRYVLLAGSKQVPLCYADPKAMDEQEMADTVIKAGQTLGMDPVQLQQMVLQRRQPMPVAIKKDLTPEEVQAVEALALPGVSVTYQTLLNRRVATCVVDPSQAENPGPEETVRAVGHALDLDPVEIDNLASHPHIARYMVIKKNLTEAEAQTLRSTHLSGIAVTYEWQREYPAADLASSVVGFRLHDGRPGGGLELSQQRRLEATPGVRVVLADACRRPIWPLSDRSRPPRDGECVFLTIDAVVQGYLQEAVSQAVEKYQAKWGTGVLVNPNTGEVLAMCSAPTFDPANFSTVSPDCRLNRALSVPYEPGSAAKPIFAAAAVDSGEFTWETKIFCENGSFQCPKGGHIGDHGHRYGLCSLTDVIAISSNIGMAKVGLKMGNARLYAIARRFGLGQPTGIELPGESGGILRDLRKWDTYSTPRVPFGQEISTTALQLAMAFSALANGGNLLKPRLIDLITDPDGNVVYQGRTEIVRRVVSPAVSAQTIGVMQEVVERGTAKTAQMDRWTCFGKTGTAQIFERGHLLDGAYTGSFIGGAPATNPRVLCVISIYRPKKSIGYYGGTVAAPSVKQVLEQTLTYLEVPPDRTEPRGHGTHGGQGAGAPGVPANPRD